MDLKNMKDNVLAKADNRIDLFYSPDKSGGNPKQEAIQNGNQLNEQECGFSPFQ
jgi:hypothetical protein